MGKKLKKKKKIKVLKKDMEQTKLPLQNIFDILKLMKKNYYIRHWKSKKISKK